MTSQQADSMSAIMIEQANRLFLRHVTKEQLADADRGNPQTALWAAVEEAGLPLAMIPEDAGGIGFSASEAMSLVRLSAYHTLPLPLAETIVAGALWALAGGAAIEGALSLGPANPSDAIRFDRERDGIVLEGCAGRIPWAGQAAVLLYGRDRDGGGHLLRVDQGRAQADAGVNLANEPRASLDLNGLRLSADQVRPAPSACGDAGMMPFGALIRAHQMVGAMERCLDYSTAYAIERSQFGRPLAKFQAVQQMLAVAAGHCAAASAAADLAAEAFGADLFEFNVAVAKSRAGEAAGKVAEIAHQVHGAMGFTQEHPLHLATRRLWSWRDEFGAESYWQERLGRLVCSRGGDALWPMLAGA